MSGLFDTPEVPVPIQTERYYIARFKPTQSFDRIRSTTVFKDEGIMYEYGIAEAGAIGSDGEVIAVMFERAKGWTATRVKAWLTRFKGGLPTPSNKRPPVKR